jgi:hypothetical protein
MKIFTAEEIGNSFINGNISWVREQIENHKSSYKIYNEVLSWLEKNKPESTKDFRRTI